MARGIRIPASKEEKVAAKLSDIVNDYTLDIEEVGKSFARVAPIISYNRVMDIAEVAQLEREGKLDELNSLYR
jgi:hypothetical protein